MSAVLEIKDELAAVLKENGQPLSERATELIVLELYRRGDISGGKAAELLEMDRLEFIQYSGSQGIPYFRYTKEEWEQELKAAKELAKEYRSRTQAPS